MPFPFKSLSILALPLESFPLLPFSFIGVGRVPVVVTRWSLIGLCSDSFSRSRVALSPTKSFVVNGCSGRVGYTWLTIARRLTAWASGYCSILYSYRLIATFFGQLSSLTWGAALAVGLWGPEMTPFGSGKLMWARWRARRTSTVIMRFVRSLMFGRLGPTRGNVVSRWIQRR
jgi:hypothetical protein